MTCLILEVKGQGHSRPAEVHLLFVLCFKHLLVALLQDFLLLVIRLLESPSVVIRAKAFLAVQQLACNSNDMLLAACENR